MRNGYIITAIAFLPYIFILGILQFIGMKLAKISLVDSSNMRTPEQNLIVSFFTFLGSVLFLLFASKFIEKRNIRCNYNVKKETFWFGLGGGFFIMAIAYFILYASKEISFNKFSLNIYFLAFFLASAIFTAVAEEVVFRGFVLRNFMLSSNKYFALILSSLLFSLVHLVNPNSNFLSFANIFLGGILLGFPYLMTKDIWFSIFLHFAWNFFQSLFGFHVSGQNFYSLIEFEIKEKNLINGGFFGFEGSILCFFLQLIAIIFMLFYFKRRKQVIDHR